MNRLESIDKEELHNIGQCLLDCIESHRFEGCFNIEYLNGEKQWSYNKDRYLFELVCDLFELNKEYELYNRGYEHDQVAES